jgi:DNA-binding MarR family transcriptional regulator
VVRMDTLSRSKQRATTPPAFQRWQEAARELIFEITLAAEQIAAARDMMGQPVFRTDPAWRVIAAVARSPYCLAIADLGRALQVRRQVAHRLAHAAAQRGYIDLVPNPHDRRILQALLTPLGRNELAAAKSIENRWLLAVLNGLGDRDMATTTHVVRVIRQRIARDARELARQKRIPLKS